MEERAAGWKGDFSFDLSDIRDIITSRFNEEMSRLRPRNGGSGSGGEGSENLGNEGGDPAALLKAMSTAFVTVITEGVSQVLDKCLTKIFEDVRKQREEVDPGERRINDKLRKLAYDNDHLEQYTRRENIRIQGVKEKNGETTEDLEETVVTLCKDAGVDVAASDLAAVHRVGKKGGWHRQIIVRFVSR